MAINTTPPVAVISRIMGSVNTLLLIRASRDIPPWKKKMTMTEAITPGPRVDGESQGGEAVHQGLDGQLGIIAHQSIFDRALDG